MTELNSTVAAWRKDPDFSALPDAQKAQAFQGLFESQATPEFAQLPPAQRAGIVQQFMADSMGAPAPQAPQPTTQGNSTLPTLGTIYRAVGRGSSTLGRTAGTAIEALGGATGLDAIEQVGHDMDSYFKKQIEGQFHDPQAQWTGPSSMVRPAWWVSNLVEQGALLLPTMGSGVAAGAGIRALGAARNWTPDRIARLARIGQATAAGGTGGTLEGSQTYQEVKRNGGTEGEAQQAGALMTLASAGLNALGADRILKRIDPTAKRKLVQFALNGATEGLTEFLEEPAEGFIKMGVDQGDLKNVWQQTKEGVGVIPIAALLGGGVSAARSSQRGAREPSPQADPVLDRAQTAIEFTERVQAREEKHKTAQADAQADAANETLLTKVEEELGRANPAARSSQQGAREPSPQADPVLDRAQTAIEFTERVQAREEKHKTAQADAQAAYETAIKDAQNEAQQAYQAAVTNARNEQRATSQQAIKTATQQAKKTYQHALRKARLRVYKASQKAIQVAERKARRAHLRGPDAATQQAQQAYQAAVTNARNEQRATSQQAIKTATQQAKKTYQHALRKARLRVYKASQKALQVAERKAQEAQTAQIETAQAQAQATYSAALTKAQAEFTATQETESEGDYLEKVDAAPPVKRSVDPASRLKEITNDLLVPLSTEVEKINPELAHNKEVGLRGFEFNLNQNIKASQEAAQPFLQGFDALKKSNPRDWKLLDRALKNGNPETLNRLLTKHNLIDEHQQATQAIEAIAQEAEKVGYEVPRRDNYWPRSVKNYDQMVEDVQKRDPDGRISKTIKEVEQQKGRALDAQEKAQVVDSVLRGSPRGFPAKPGNLKERKIGQIDSQLDPYYTDSSEALLSYMERMHTAIQTRQLFGKYTGTPAEMTGDQPDQSQVNEDIGAYVAAQIDAGRVAPKDEARLAALLQSRFGYRPLGGFLSNLRDATYIATMGNSMSAITQLGDIVGALYFGGVKGGLKAYGQAVAGRSQITTKELGIDNLGEEFRTPEGLALWLDRTFRFVGINKLDQWGKEAASSAILTQLQKRARQNKLTDRDQRRIKEALGERAPQAIEDLAAGNKTPDTLFLVYDRIADLQPLSRSEVPKSYLDNPRGRLFYQLKTFFIRRLDFMRREAVNDMRKGQTRTQRIQGGRNLVKLSALIMMAEGSTDVLKDFILGRDIDLEDTTVNNLLKLIGISKFHAYVFRKEGPGQTAVQLALPPQFGLIKDTYRDAAAVTKDDFTPRDLRTWGRIPIAGKFYHWWLGQGRTSELKSRRRDLNEDYKAYYKEAPAERDKDDLAALLKRRRAFNALAKEHPDRVKPFTKSGLKALARAAAKDR